MAMASLLHHHHHHLHHQFRELSRISIPPSPPALQIICCSSSSSSSSKKKKAVHKRKPILVKHRKHPHLPHTSTDDILLGVGAGATTLTALQPRQDPELPSQLQIVLERLSTLPDFGPLASPCQPPQSPSASHGTQLADFALPEPAGGFERRHRALESEEAEGDEGEYMVDETEWSEEEEDQRVECWEGDMEPMTEEEEAELLREAEKEIAELEKNRIALQGMEVGGDLRAGLDADESIFYPASVGGLEYSSSDWEWDELAAPGSSTQSRDSVGRIGWRELREEGLSPVRNENLPEVNVPTRATDVFMAEEMTKEWELEGQGGENDTLIQGPAEEYQTEFPEAGWEEGIDEGEEKSRRSIPAVMRCFDRAKIYVKAGDGGNGVVAFRREKYVPYGGPSGGSGGRGGNVYIEAVSSMNSLLPFRKSVHYRAGRGSHGQGKSQDGAAGQDCTVKVPPGTVVREAGQDLTESGAVLVELTRPGQCELLLPGGRGGRGNAAFKTGRNKAPQLAENGEEGAEMWLELELKLVADVGIIGVPNAGKSTLLSAISAAKPAIGDYPFTTLLPNLGVVSIGYDASMVVADLPGLLEGAHLGIGLGHEFLRHTERCRVLVHVVDGMSPQPEYEYEAVRLELQLFNPALASKPNIVAFNKKDIPEAAERWKKFQASLQQKGIEPICMSAATKSGTSEVVHKAYELLKYELTTDNALEIEDRSFQVGDMVRKQRSAPVEEFEIFCNTHTRTWQVQGVGLERFTQMTNWEYFEAFKRFQHVLISSGVNQALKERGVKEGDTVIVGQMEFNWHDSEDFSAAGDWKRGSRGSRLWPH